MNEVLKINSKLNRISSLTSAISVKFSTCWTIRSTIARISWVTSRPMLISVSELQSSFTTPDMTILSVSEFHVFSYTRLCLNQLSPVHRSPFSVCPTCLDPHSIFLCRALLSYTRAPPLLNRVLTNITFSLPLSNICFARQYLCSLMHLAAPQSSHEASDMYIAILQRFLSKILLWNWQKNM